MRNTISKIYNNFLTWFLRQVLIPLANKWDWLGRIGNKIAINRLVNVSRYRPHPWSNAHSYISWTSLTDQRWSARHLPEGYLQDLPELRDERLKSIFKRPNGKMRPCEKSTCLFPAFAQYLTDGFIRTIMPEMGDTLEERIRKRRQNTSNHQIDLCPLYGRIPEQTEALRLKNKSRDKRGRLKSQMIDGEEYAPFLFRDDLTIKPEFFALDIPLGLTKMTDAEARKNLFADNPQHGEESFAIPPELRTKLFAFGGDRTNAIPYVAMINTLFLREHNRLAGEIEKKNSSWDDERVFQTARNITIVLFIKIVVEEYINHISPHLFRLRADPSVAWGAPWNQPNWITTEFSLLYRWHSLVPDTMTWKGKSYDIGSTLMNNNLLLEAGLAGAFTDMSVARAGGIGPLNTAEAILEREISAIEQGRFCNLRSYSDYREYVALPKPEAFSDISTNPKVIEILEDLYKKPGNVEFYVGLFSEDTVKNSPLSPLLLSMVAMDAFSQALTNPLLSKNVYGNSVNRRDAFTALGLETIENTSSLRDLLELNCPNGIGNARISMTRKGWKPLP
jgi:prostaglandin-endoperoxide synthase 2